VTSPDYNVWVIAVNTIGETESDMSTEKITEAPADLKGTVWKSGAGATYEFTDATVIYKSADGKVIEEGTYGYDKPTLPLAIPALTDPGPITVSGKTFTINSVTFTRQ
jgi:hypothetical protein